MKILKIEIFVNIDKKLRAAHLILNYNPFSFSFQVPKCVIKAKDPRLHQINVAVLVSSSLIPSQKAYNK